MLGAPVEPVMPAALGRLQKAHEHQRVTGYTVILIVPAQLERQLTVLLAHWHMAMFAAPPSDTSDRPAKAVGGCFPLDHPIPTPGLCPKMGKAQQIERPPTRGLRWPTRATASRRTEVDQSGLIWVQVQAVLAESLRQYGQHPTRIFLLAEGQHRIVRVADQDRSALEPRLDVPLEPHVQHLVQEDVRQQRSEEHTSA